MAQCSALLCEALSEVKSLAPLDLLSSERLPLLKALYDRFDVPTEFVSERVSSVTGSFGSFESEENYSEKVLSAIKDTGKLSLTKFAGHISCAKTCSLSLTPRIDT